MSFGWLVGEGCAYEGLPFQGEAPAWWVQCQPAPLSLHPTSPPFLPPRRLVLRPADVDSILAPLPRLRRLVLSRQPAGYGFGPYISAATGAAWDTSSVEALMHLARRLPQLAVELERTLPPCLPPAEQGGEEGAEPASAAL